MQFTIPVVFACKPCEVVFNSIKEFIQHKKTIHCIEIQKLKCIVFEECSSATQRFLLQQPQTPKTHEPDAIANTTTTNTHSNSSITWKVPVFIPISTIIKEETDEAADAEPELEKPLQAKENHLLPLPSASTSNNVCPSCNRELPSTNVNSTNSIRESQRQQPYVLLRRLKLQEIQPDSSFTNTETCTKKGLQNRSPPNIKLLKPNPKIFKNKDKVGHKLKAKSTTAVSTTDISRENQNLCSTNTDDEDKLFKKSLRETWHLTAFRKSRMYKCPTRSCKKLFHSFHTLKLHMMQQHSCKFKKAQSLFTCNICKSKFRSSVYLNKHVVRDHIAERMREIQNRNQSGQIAPTTKENTLRYFFCCSKEDCSFSFGSKEELATHERLHNATQYKKCPKNKIVPPVFPTW